MIEDEETKKFFMVMEYMEKGSLMSDRYWSLESEKKAKMISEAKLKKYFRDFLLGLDYCKYYLVIFFL